MCEVIYYSSWNYGPTTWNGLLQGHCTPEQLYYNTKLEAEVLLVLSTDCQICFELCFALAHCNSFFFFFTSFNRCIYTELEERGVIDSVYV